MEKNVNAQAQVNEHAVAVDAEKEAKFKAAKAEAAKKFKEKKAAEKKTLEEIAKRILPKAAEFKLTDAEIELLQKLANPATASGGNSTFFNKVFGDSPKVGDKVTLIEFFEKTQKAQADLDRYVKQWAEKGTIVEKKVAAKLLDTTYTIKAIGSK